MTTSNKLTIAAVAISSFNAASISEGMVSVCLGLAGVALARQVFIGRERRQTGRKQPFRDTFPLTLCAMLVTGVIVYDRQLGFSMAVFTGLGVGWSAILLLEILGAGMLKWGKRVFGVEIDDIKETPPDMRRLLRELDEETKDG